MRKASKTKSAVIGLLLPFCATPARADDAIEKAGIGVGLTIGNVLFAPIKAISVSMGLISGAVSLLVTGGNLDLSRQIWQDTTQGPYLITAEVAKKAVGERPEVEQ